VPPFTVLQVCMGNICRSPMAERLLVAAARRLVDDRHQVTLDHLLLVHGAGTGGWHVGAAMDPGAARQVTARGGDPAGFAARQIDAAAIESSDLILTATIDQRGYVGSIVPDAIERTFVLGEFGRLLRGLDPTGLPPFAFDPHAVHARGVAIVAAAAKLRAGEEPRPDDEIDDPYGRTNSYFAEVADTIEATTTPFARLLLS
jgi:protein-tyrosine phosphatase